jgi:hypothetical protein
MPRSPDGRGHRGDRNKLERIAMAVSARYRDKDGEISRKHGNTPMSTLRITYGGEFAKGCANDEKLSDVLAKLDQPSLSRLVRDHKAGILPIRLRTPWITAARGTSKL